MMGALYIFLIENTISAGLSRHGISAVSSISETLDKGIWFLI